MLWSINLDGIEASWKQPIAFYFWLKTIAIIFTIFIYFRIILIVINTVLNCKLPSFSFRNYFILWNQYQINISILILFSDLYILLLAISFIWHYHKCYFMFYCIINKKVNNLAEIRQSAKSDSTTIQKNFFFPRQNLCIYWMVNMFLITKILFKEN